SIVCDGKTASNYRRVFTEEGFPEARRPCEPYAWGEVIFVSRRLGNRALLNWQRWIKERGCWIAFACNGLIVKHIERLASIFVPDTKIQRQVRLDFEVVLYEVVLIVFREKQQRVSGSNRYCTWGVVYYTRCRVVGVRAVVVG